MDAGKAAGGIHILVGGRGPRVADVVHERVVEQHRLLRHDAEVAAQAGDRDVADVGAVDGDGAAVGVVEAEEQAQQRRLAAAAFADDGDGRARWDVERDVFQRGPPPVVGEGDVAEGDVAVAGGHLGGVGLVDDGGLLVELVLVSGVAWGLPEGGLASASILSASIRLFWICV